MSDMTEIDIERVRWYTGWNREMTIAAIRQWREANPEWTSGYIEAYRNDPLVATTIASIKCGSLDSSHST